eukprot:6200055-Pleurochrysis_carterae.AAC.7
MHGPAASDSCTWRERLGSWRSVSRRGDEYSQMAATSSRPTAAGSEPTIVREPFPHSALAAWIAGEECAEWRPWASSRHWIQH